MKNAPFPAHLPDERSARACDRVLLYTRGMELEPLDSVDMAREALLRAGEHPSIPDTIQSLRTLIREKGLAHGLLDDKGERLASAPPMNRQPMIAEPLDRSPWLTAVKRLGRRKGDRKTSPL